MRSTALLVNLGAAVLIAVLPFLVAGVLSPGDLPQILAYVFFPGRHWLIVLGMTVAAVSLLDARGKGAAIVGRLDDLASKRWFPLLLLGFISIVSFVRVPQEEKEAEQFGGDEPKYLRIAFSLLRDLDADIGSGRTVPPDLPMRVQQIRNLVLETRDSALDLFAPVVVPPGHVWNAGNWSVNGLHGGVYHLQPPGLPALVAVALGVGEVVLPERDPGISVEFLLSILWILAARELWLLFREVTGDRLFATLFAAALFLSAPVFIGGYQLFPESLSLLLFPFLLRRLRTSDRPLRIPGAMACGFLSGYLFWIHPKLTLVALFFAALGLFRPATSPRAKGAFAVTFAIVAFLSLLYCHHISGLFRPEGLYIRQAEEYVGSPNPFSLRFIAGLVKGLIGGRDGLLLFAPVLTLGLIATGLTRTRLRTSLELWSLFIVVWMTSAVHDGASLGSPSRLMMPIAFVPAFFLFASVREGRSRARVAAAVFLLMVGAGITNDMTRDWRKNVNPYRGMFADPATNFEPSLPGNSFSDPAYLVDIEKAALVFVVFLAAAIAIRRDEKDPSVFAPALFGVGTLAALVVLACGLPRFG